MSSRFCTCILGICIVATLCGAAPDSITKPDFTGAWTLDPLRSRLENTQSSTKMTLTIEHREPKLRIEVTGDQGPQDYGFDLTTDGNEVKRAIKGEPHLVSARWGDIDGTRLMLVIKRESPSGTVVVTRMMKLGDKGKMLTTVMTVEDPKGKKTGSEFFTKQP